MYEVISIGSSLVDIFIRSRSFSLESAKTGTLLCQHYGDKLEVDDFQVLTGGGGSNTAVGFARLGFRTGVISELGQDSFAQFVLNDFHKEHVLTNLIIKEKKEKTGGSVVLVDSFGGRTAMVHRGAASMLDPKDIQSGPVRRAGWVHLSSINGRLSTLEKIFKLRKNTKNLSWNPGRRELELLRTHQVDFGLWPIEIFLVNKEEWLSLGTVSRLILRKTPVTIITNGARTGAVITRKQSFNFKPPQIVSTDDTGAGDAFSTGFISAYIHSLTLEATIKLAVANAQSVVKYFGAKPGLIKKYNW